MEFQYTAENEAYMYKPTREKDPVKIAESERKFQELWERLEQDEKKTA